MFKLVISDDEGRATVVPLARDEVTVGRGNGNTIRLTERNVSRSHAKFVKHNGSFLISDLSSYNGVHINGKRIDAQVALTDGDRVAIGDYQIAFEAEEIDVDWNDETPVQIIAPSRLVVLTEPAPGAEFSLSKPQQRIGRDETIDIFINHKSVSHEHAEIVVGYDDVRIVDLESANGVRINGKHVTESKLAPGDLVEVGEVLFRFEPPVEPAHLPADPVEFQAAPAEVRSGGSHSTKLLLGVVGAVAVLGAVAFIGKSAFAPNKAVVTPVESSSTSTTTLAEAEPLEIEDPNPTNPTMDGITEEQLAVVADSAQACQAAVAQADWEEAMSRAGGWPGHRSTT